MDSRRRGYTPSTGGAQSAQSGAVHGESKHYIGYLRDIVVPFAAQPYRTDENRRLFVGHSYGGLLGLDLLAATGRRLDALRWPRDVWEAEAAAASVDDAGWTGA